MIQFIVINNTKGITIKNFDTLNLSKEILLALEDLKYIKPTVVQTKVIPIALKKIDVLGVAQSGTGKTAAFTLPMLQALGNKKEGSYV